jgi:hypothetical protein
MLRCLKQLYGDKLGATDGEIGQVKDFYFDDQNWAMAQLIIKTGHRFSGQELEIPTNKVERISGDESKVFVSLTKKEVKQSPVHPLSPVGAAD